MKSQFLIAAPMSGSGKTTIARGLMALLVQKGYKVQPYKCGPDYIDTKFHEAVCGRPSINLDTFMATPEHVRTLFHHYGDDADVSIVEGMMGLFDGYDRDSGSSYEIARELGLPIVLVVDAKSAAYSMAALLSGFLNFRSDVRFDPAPDVKGKARPFEKPKGTLDAWVAGIQPIRTTSVAFRAMLAASFASPLVAILGVQVFAVYLWGMSGSGKTPSLKAAGSVWGDSTEGADSYYGTFNDTSKFIVRKAAFLGDLPILVDELHLPAELLTESIQLFALADDSGHLFFGKIKHICSPSCAVREVCTFYSILMHPTARPAQSCCTVSRTGR